MTLGSIVGELAHREALRDAILLELTPKQLTLYEDGAQFVAAHPGRRAGKSEAMPRFAILAALVAGFKETVLLCAETKQKARALYWGDLLALLFRHNLLKTWHVNAAESIITTPWGSTVTLWGASDLQAVNLVRGFKLARVLADEVATWGSQQTGSSLLETFVYDVVEPALGDTKGSLLLAGTPSQTRTGPWFEICTGLRPGWSVHHWDVRDNPKFPRDPHQFIEETLERNGWTVDTARFRREYLGQFVNDDTAQVYRYNETRNLGAMPDDYDRERWVHSLGVDFGLRDQCAWTVLASHPHRKDIWALHSHKAADLLPEQASRVTEALVNAYAPDVLVGDSGGMGVSYVEHWNRRHDVGMHMEAALKKDKRGMIDLMNGELGSGRMKLVEGQCDPLAEELQTLPWSANLIDVNPMFDNHCSDSCLYAFRHHTAYLNEGPARTLPATLSDPDEDAYIDELDRRALSRGTHTDFWDDDEAEGFDDF